MQGLDQQNEVHADAPWHRRAFVILAFLFMAFFSASSYSMQFVDIHMVILKAFVFTVPGFFIFRNKIRSYQHVRDTGGPPVLVMIQLMLYCFGSVLLCRMIKKTI